jgi:hypothetical protein
LDSTESFFERNILYCTDPRLIIPTGNNSKCCA